MGSQTAGEMSTKEGLMLCITFPISMKGEDQSLLEQGLLWVRLSRQGVAGFPAFAV